MTTEPVPGSAGSEGVPSDEGRIPEKIGKRDVERLVIKFTNNDSLLEIEGDDVDLGTDLKVRYKHRLVAEFRREAVDGWWYKSYVLNEEPPYGGTGNALDIGDVAPDPGL